jgi:hypothetical protein
MWTWWNSKISGEVPLMYTPSEDLLLNHSRLMKNIDPKEELVFLDEFKNENGPVIEQLFKKYFSEYTKDEMNPYKLLDYIKEKNNIFYSFFF